MYTGKTKSGFEFEVDETRFNDMEYIELVVEAQKSILSLPAVVEKLLGAEQKKALYEHVRTDDGRVPIEAIDAEINEIIDANEEIKN